MALTKKHLTTEKENHMGYNTQFQGSLKISPKPTPAMLAALTDILGEDCRNHPEWKAGDLTHMDLDLTRDFLGLCWNGSEKTYDLVEKVNLVTRLMRAQFPTFKLSGKLLAQGEDMSDRWQLVMVDGVASRKAVR